ncbi:MAG TPA: hypothetical protein GX014_08020 [Firmicutes bacterium]|nr:hypothetical protein [Bacillota bacterium]
MKLKHYIPLIVFLLLAGAAVVQGLRRDVTPQQLQSQVAAPENSLDQIASLELEIELVEGKEVQMRYSRQAGDDDSAERVRMLIEALPPLGERRPLAIIQAALDHLEIDETNVQEFELEYELGDNFERKIELDVDRYDDD